MFHHAITALTYTTSMSDGSLENPLNGWNITYFAYQLFKHILCLDARHELTKGFRGRINALDIILE
jgi:hypothetical protein